MWKSKTRYADSVGATSTCKKTDSYGCPYTAPSLALNRELIVDQRGRESFPSYRLVDKVIELSLVCNSYSSSLFVIEFFTSFVCGIEIVEKETSKQEKVRRVMNGPIVSVARELGFEGNSIIEGLVVSIFIAGAFLRSSSSGSIIDKLGCKFTIQIDAIPLILGAICRSTLPGSNALGEILLASTLEYLLKMIPIGKILYPISRSLISLLAHLFFLTDIIALIAQLLEKIKFQKQKVFPGKNFKALTSMVLQVSLASFLELVGRLNDAKEVIYNHWGPNEWRLLEVAFFLLQQFAGINGILYFLSLTFRDVGVTSGALASVFVGLTIFTAREQKLLIGSYLGMGFNSI
ncbi:probable plastidic glucose transporter 1 [Tripterygium wilfordii]|uniref:probable plastidic glucose transporter 1 n=1 Tax=Tripterygium wilfordii TaxID=458696 RepID=UPI0018F7F94F|nr:probable plastidic glucose transporter 1 [Tripterygium wilfordii]